MAPVNHAKAQQVAMVASKFHRERTGHAPTTVSVVLSGETLVITLYNALSIAERAMASTPEGAARVQDYHRHLFASSSDELRNEIKRITGVEVREAAAEIDPETGSVVHAFTSGAMVQMFLMSGSLGDSPVSARIDSQPTPLGPDA